jgi:uncharacterized membrane protein YtjA (UPF0391 family)
MEVEMAAMFGFSGLTVIAISMAKAMLLLIVIFAIVSALAGWGAETTTENTAGPSTTLRTRFRNLRLFHMPRGRVAAKHP